ncbi:MAG: mechanosensitive ion channel protein MscS [Rhodobacterales bacterium RIFCSPHIGHO2_02_FULL_62_130]|nr:MAG: mechanosensitive ion channel protein MscS [Rhodobacterales bacterium RIFCSPHIGHO2_02_FULL_62_130]OHC55173.1 MAG: mechanosensitive ion channel protein MscS [Rhodobacterales bacterium RIFCSPHIGHO2_12_FULL_62_75]
MTLRPHWQAWAETARAACAAVMLALLPVAAPVPAGAQATVDGPTRQVDDTGALLPRVDADGALVTADAPVGPVNGKPAKGGSGGAAPSSFDYAAWDRMAKRTEKAIESTVTTSVALEHIRAQLVDWRAALLGAQSSNSDRIATLRTQIEALGPPPAEGEEEAAEIAKRRTELSAQLVRLQAPGIAADEAYQRADGLIREIDRVLRERQADQLLQLWPMPINPANWPDGLRALSDTAVALWSETQTQIGRDEARAQLTDNLPVVLAYLALALAILWRGRQWIDALTLRLQDRASEQGRRIWAFLASLGQIVVPIAGVVLLSVALARTGMLGVMGRVIVDNLPNMGLMFFAAVWLGGRLFPQGQNAYAPLNLSDERRAEGRFLSAAFGVLLATESLRQVAMDQLDATEAATSVLSFPVLVLTGLLLLRIGQLMRRHVANEEATDEGRSYGTRLMGILARGAMAVGVIGPSLGAVGYISAASAMVFPAVLSLALVGILSVMQHLVGEVYAMLTGRRAVEGRDGLVPVLIGFALTLATLPLFALIWGARMADLTELWTRFREGIQLGDTRISPTVFLFFAVVFGIGFTLTRLFQGALKTSILPRTGLDQGGQNATVSGVGYVGIFLSALIAINAAGIDLSGLAIVAGALSVGIGFGLQTIVSNFVSGIILLIERPVSEGDWIEVGTTTGIVKSISVRSTRIQTFDRSDVIVPNSDLISGRVTNWTRFNLSGRLVVPVAVPFTTDSRRVEAILRQIAEAQPLAMLNPPPVVALMGFGAETMNFEIRLILRDVNFQVQVRSEINHQIAARFAAEGIMFSNAHRDHLKREADAAALESEEAAEASQHQAEVAALLAPSARLLPPKDPA